MAFGSGNYPGMQQQFTGISPQRQQQQCNSGFPSMNPSQMIPRSPNNGMMQPDMDLVLQQQQYQQQPQQSAYGNGNYQGYNGGYQGSRTVSPQTHSQAMSPYQGGFPPDPSYPSGAGSGQTMGEFGPQTGPSHPMGMAGPASLSLAAMSNRQQQYYSDGYGMSQPVSPVRKQMPQGTGFLPPSGMPYSQQVQYQPSSYPKRPPSSPVQAQMQGFSFDGSSYTPRSSTGMQPPNMPYPSSTNPYQPPCSPGRRSSTSPVPQQDAGMYGRPHEHFSQPRSPFGTGQGHFQQVQQQQQQQQQQHSSCMFVQPSTTPPQSHYQSQQLKAPTKTGSLTQRRASYPGQQNTVKMPSPPLKRSPPTKTTSPNATSPDLARAGHLGFEERGSLKPFSAKEKASSPPSSDPSQVISEPTVTVSNAVQCSFKKKATNAKKTSETHKGVPRQRRSASDADRPSVSPPIVKREHMDWHKSNAEEIIGKEGSVKNIEGSNKDYSTETKSEETNGSSENKSVASHSSKRQEDGQEEGSLQSSSDSKGGESSCNIGEDEQNQRVVNTTKPEKAAALETASKAPQSVVNSEKEHKETEESVVNTSQSGRMAKSPIKELGKEETSHENAESTDKHGKESCVEKKELSRSKDVNCKGVLSLVIEQKSGNNEVQSANPVKGDKLDNKSHKSDDDTSGTSGETGIVDNKTSTTGHETGKPRDSPGKLGDQSEENGSKTRKTSQANDDETGKISETGGDTKACEANKTVTGKGKEGNDDNSDKVENSAKEAGEVEGVQETDSKGSSEKREVTNKTDKAKVISKESSGATEKSQSNKDSGVTQDAKAQRRKGSLATPSLRCDERLSSDDDDRLQEKTPVESESDSVHVVESRTLGIQTVQQSTATARTTHQQATPIKATIIAKGKSSHNNQQVMVAKTTTGKMYLIQGNILMPVQKMSSKDDPSNQNPQVIIVNPVPKGSGSKQSATAAKGADAKEVSKERKEGKAQAGTSQSSSQDKASKVSDKKKAGTETSSGNEKSDQSVKKSEGLHKTMSPVKNDKSPTSKGTKNSPTQHEKGSKTGEKANQTDKTESPRAKRNPDSKNESKTAETSTQKEASSEKANQEPTQKQTRGRPVGSKDKQKRKPYVHKVKRKQDDREVEDVNSQEPVVKRKFSKTAIAVQEMSSSAGPSVASTKRPVDAPTVSASRPPKKRKISTSSSPVKHIMSTKPRGGVDGDTWVCSFCGRRSGSNLLGDLYGPYKTKFSKEKTAESSSKEGKLSQKLSSPGRKTSSSSDVQADSESCDVDLWIHRDCGVWSPGVFMIGRTVHGLEQAVESAAQHVSYKCIVYKFLCSDVFGIVIVVVVLAASCVILTMNTTLDSVVY